VTPAGGFERKVEVPATKETLATVVEATEGEVNSAVAAARAAFPGWAAQSGTQRAKVLYSLARHVQKHSRLLAGT
jgi:aldehyde dehydrogenase (NAD+)